MPSLDDIKWLIDFCESIGLTFDNLIPPAIVIGVFFYIFNKKAISPIRDNMSDIKGKLHDFFNATRELQQHVCQNNDKELLHKLPTKLKFNWSTHNSPLTLNKQGTALSEASGIKGIVEENEDKLLDLLKKCEPDNPYDVQQKSFGVLGNFVINDEKSENKVKDFLYNNPEFKGNAVELPDVIYVGSLVLRDKYLNKFEVKSS